MFLSVHIDFPWRLLNLSEWLMFFPFGMAEYEEKKEEEEPLAYT